MRELVKVKSDNPSHAGYYTTYRDQMKPDDVEFGIEPANPDEPELTVAQIKAKLAELNIEIPKEVTRKADLIILLNKGKTNET